MVIVKIKKYMYEKIAKHFCYLSWCNINTDDAAYWYYDQKFTHYYRKALKLEDKLKEKTNV